MNRLIYFDNSATTKPLDEVVDIMCSNLKNDYFNPSSAYKQGVEVGKKIQISRDIVSKAIGCDGKELIFTSAGTESINTAINCACKTSKKNHIITSSIEHDATLKTMAEIEKKGYKVTYLKPNKDGVIHWEQIKSNIIEETFFVSLMQVNNELGSIIDIEKIGNELNKLGIKFHVDAIQGFLKQRINVKKSKIDFLSLSAHKVNGPKGIGALYINKEIRFEPYIFGGGQESGKRSGTENVSGIIGFGEAVQFHTENFERNINHYKQLKEHLLELLNEKVVDFVVNSPENGADNILNISFLGAKSEVLLNTLAAKGILVSSGSACSSKKKSSHVLEGIGLSNEKTDAAIRISFGWDNTIDEIHEFINTIKVEIEDIRRFTKYKKGR